MVKKYGYQILSCQTTQYTMTYTMMKGRMPNMDDMTPLQRHRNMQHIRSSNTKPEIMLRKALWHIGIRYRKNYSKLPGKPDIALTKQKIAIFIDGDFWVLSIFFRKIMNRILVAVSQGWSRHRTHTDASCPYISLHPIGSSRHDAIWRRQASRHSLHQGRYQ